MKIDSLNYNTMKRVIERYGYNFYVIKRFTNIKCNCVDSTTKDANPSCPHCLGTGYKIKIQKVHGCIREQKEREISIAQNLSSSPKVVYIEGLLRLEKDDMVIDDEAIYHITSLQWHRGEKGEPGFTRCICPFTKSNDAVFIKNFYKLINEYKLRKN